MLETQTPGTPDDETRHAELYRLQQARRLLDEVAAGLPPDDPLRQAIERGRGTDAGR
jgi:hypothetical protein